MLELWVHELQKFGVMSPFQIVAELRCGLDEALDLLLHSFREEQFSVFSKLDIHAPGVQGEAKFKRCIILRAVFPRLGSEANGIRSCFAGLINCSAILRELSPCRVHLQLSKPIRLLNPDDAETTRKVREVDLKLTRILLGLEANLSGAPPLREAG